MPDTTKEAKKTTLDQAMTRFISAAEGSGLKGVNGFKFQILNFLGEADGLSETAAISCLNYLAEVLGGNQPAETKPFILPEIQADCDVSAALEQERREIASNLHRLGNLAGVPQMFLMTVNSQIGDLQLSLDELQRLHNTPNSDPEKFRQEVTRALEKVATARKALETARGQLSKLIELIRTGITSLGEGNQMFEEEPPQEVSINKLLVELEREGVFLVPPEKSDEVEVRLYLTKEVMFVRGDELKIKDALINIISNAIKFTQQGSIEVQARKINGCFVFEIKDTGGGVSEEKVPQLFQAHQRVGAEKTDVPGTGMGLFSAKSVAEACGGEAYYQENKDLNGKRVGSIFYIRLPLYESAVTTA